MSVRVEHGDCRDVVRTLADCSVDSCVTDPPYSLVSIQKRFGKPGSAPAQEGRDGLYRRASAGFMGAQWDTGETAHDPAFWAEILRVLKPGAHLMAFGGTRTYHRMVCAIEDAGFEIRDCIFWAYGSGFPKSHDVSKGIDRRGPNAAAPSFPAFARHYAERRTASGLTHSQVCNLGKFYGTVNHGGTSVNWEMGVALPTAEQWEIVAPVLGLDAKWRTRVVREEYRREIIGRRKVSPGLAFTSDGPDELTVTAPGCEASKQWEGWGTALKPAIEPICLARKPLSEPTIAANVLKWGCGALNINATRIHLGTKGKFLAHARHILSRAETELGSNMSCTVPELGADEFRRTLGSILSAEGLTLLSGDRVAANEHTGSRPEGSSACYRVCRHFCDGLALWAEAIAQSLSPQQLCARIHSRLSMPSDDPASAKLDSRLYECTSRLASLDFASSLDRALGSDVEPVRRAFVEYLVQCRASTGTALPAPSTAVLADKASRFLFQSWLKSASAYCMSDGGSAFLVALFNIIVGPYVITNTLDLLIGNLSATSRWPANLCHDGSEEVLAAFPDAAGQQRAVGPLHGAKPSINTYGDYGPREQFEPRGDSGSAARFFYSSKAGAEDRFGSKHPTVKPVELMKWLARLVTPPRGIVLDPFAGSGTTGIACLAEGFDCILIEREDSYVADIRERLAFYEGHGKHSLASKNRNKQAQPDGPLFDVSAA